MSSSRCVRLASRREARWGRANGECPGMSRRASRSRNGADLFRPTIRHEAGTAGLVPAYDALLACFRCDGFGGDGLSGLGDRESADERAIILGEAFGEVGFERKHERHALACFG